MDFITCFKTLQINQMIGSEIPTHFLGRPLGRFSPVASAFCKGKRNTTYFIPRHYLTASVTRNSFPVTLSILISIWWHQAPLPLYGFSGGMWLCWFFWHFLASVARGRLSCAQEWPWPGSTLSPGARRSVPTHTQLCGTRRTAPASHGACRLCRRAQGSLGTWEPLTTSHLVFHRLSQTTHRY